MTTPTGNPFNAPTAPPLNPLHFFFHVCAGKLITCGDQPVTDLSKGCHISIESGQAICHEDAIDTSLASAEGSSRKRLYSIETGTESRTVALRLVKRSDAPAFVGNLSIGPAKVNYSTLDSIFQWGNKLLKRGAKKTPRKGLIRGS